MPRDSNGNYTKPNPSVVAGTTVQAAYENTNTDDQATEFTDSLSRSGKGAMLEALKLADAGHIFAAEENSGVRRVGAGDVRAQVLGSDILYLLQTAIRAAVQLNLADAGVAFQDEPTTKQTRSAAGIVQHQVLGDTILQLDGNNKRVSAFDTVANALFSLFPFPIVSTYDPKYGVKGDGGTTDDGPGVQQAITDAEGNAGGGTVLLFGNHWCNQKLTINASNVGLLGVGGGVSLRYAGGSSNRVDRFIEFTANATDRNSLTNLNLLGGPTNGGDAKWVVYAEKWLRRNIISNCTIRNGLGLVKLVDAFYGRMENVQLIGTVQDPQAYGWPKADWDEVYGADSAPIFLGGGGSGFGASKLHISSVGSQQHTGVVGQNIVIVGVNAHLDTVTYEQCGSSPRETVNGWRFTDNAVITNLSSELSAANTRFFYQTAGSVVFVNPSIYRAEATSIFVNDSVADMVVIGGQASRINAQRITRVETANGGKASRTEIIFHAFRCITGERITDPTWNPYTNNVYDTYNTRSVLGLEESQQPALQPRRWRGPEIMFNLETTAGSNANGHYVQVVCGKFSNTRGQNVSCYITVVEDRTVPAVIRLRPPTASRYYRVFMGTAGNLYLSESAVPFGSAQGDWLAQFETNASTEIINLETNLRLSQFQDSRIQAGREVYVRASPIGPWHNVGDEILYPSPTPGGKRGLVCTTAGGPGVAVFKEFGDIEA